MERSKVQRLLADCESNDPAVQRTAVLALEEANVGHAVPVIVRLLDSSDSGVRVVAAGALGRIGTDRSSVAGGALVKHLSDADPLVRSEIVDALGMLGYKPAASAVRSLLRDPSALVRASAAETLGDLGDPSALEDLELALADPDEAVRGYAANSYGQLADHEQVGVVERRLAVESSPRVRAELTGARCRLDDRAELDELLDLMMSGDETLTTQILNIVEDLMCRRTPLAVERNSQRIRAVLEQAADSFPILRAQVASVLRAMKK